MIDDIVADAESRMNKTIEALRTDFTSIRTGRASPALVDRLLVEYYGTPTPLQQLASISVPEATQILIRPFNPGDIAAIEKAILASDLGLTPNNDGQQIRLIIPALTEETRRDLTRRVSKRAEEARVAVRNIRRDAINDLRDMEKESMISQDEYRRGQDRVQDTTNEYIKRIDDEAQSKDAEIMTL